MTKFVASQTGSGRTVDLPLAGKFKKIKRTEEQQKEAEQVGAAIQYAFSPHLDFVGSGHFKYPENEFNISPFSSRAKGFASSLTTVSLTSIGAVCSMDRETVASALKAMFVGFIQAGRAGKFCKMDMRIGHLVVYPNGQLQFENYADMSGNVEDPINVDLNDQRFVRRTLNPQMDTGLGNASRAGSDFRQSSLSRARASGVPVPADKRSSSLYSSVRVNRGGFSRMSNATTVMTPYSNIGGEVSRYGGKNRMLKQWYEGKVFQPNARQLGFALNKR